MQHRLLIVRFSLVSFFILSLLPSFFGEEVKPAIKSYSSKVAVMAYHVPHEPTFYQHTRRTIYERPSLRLLRFIHRKTGVALDEDPQTFFTIAYTLLGILSVCIFIGYFKRKWRFKCYGLAALFIFKFILVLYIYSGVASLNQFDMRDPMRIQYFIDILNGQAMEYDVIDDWKSFKKIWDENLEKGHLPYSTFVWIGVPQGTEPVHVHNWINDHRQLPLFHASLGAHLPSVFHGEVFTERQPELDWDPSSSRSIVEKNSAYERHTSWQVPENQATLGVYHYGKGRLLYATTEVEPLSLSKVFIETMREIAPAGTIRLHSQNLAVLRLDDPGTAQNHYAEPWAFKALDSKTWNEVADILKENNAKMTVGVVGGWVDHGESTLGQLWVSGNQIQDRKPGQVYESRLVKYDDLVLKHTHDISAVFDTLDERPEFGLQLHGHTHITPDLESWLKADDRFEDFKWYREFLVTETFPFEQRPAQVQYDTIQAGIDKFTTAFEQPPTILIPPGHKMSWDTPALAGALGIKMVSDSSTVIMRRDEHRRTNLVSTHDMWSKMDPKPYYEANYPVTYLLHDRDIALNGVGWFKTHLESIKKKGAKQIVNLEELMLMLHGIAHAFVDTEALSYRLTFAMDPSLVNLLNQRFKEGIKLRIKPPKGYRLIDFPEGVKQIGTMSNGEWLLQFPGLSSTQLAFEFKLQAQE